MTALSNLFSPISLGKLQLPNRIMMAAIWGPILATPRVKQQAAT